MLGVIGLVIGGIWVAASAISQRQKIQDVSAVMTRLLAYYRENPLAVPAIPLFNGVSAINLTELLAVQSSQIGSLYYDELIGAYTNGQGLFVYALTYALGPTSSCPNCTFVALYVDNYTDGTFTTPGPTPALCSAISALFLQNRDNVLDNATYGGMVWYSTSYAVLGQWRPSLGAAPTFSNYGNWCANTATIYAAFIR